MHQTTRLRKSGGSLMMTMPKAILESLDLHADQELSLTIKEGKIILDPKARPRYTAAELLAQCDFNLPMGEEECAFLNSPAIGGEEI